MSAVKGIGVIQVNLNNSRMAQQLLLQTMAERGSRIAVLSEYNRPMGDSDHWAESLDKKSAVFAPNSSDAVLTEQGAGVGFAWVWLGEVLLYSCYCTPNCSIQEYDQFLGGLQLSISHQTRAPAHLVVAGDFNSHSPEWGSARLDTRGSLLSDFATSLGLSVCNVGTTPTFSRANATSVIDVTLERFPSRGCHIVTDWSVLVDIYSASDHSYIEYQVSSRSTQASARQNARARAPGWSVKKFNPAAADLFFELSGPSRPPPPDAPAAAHAERLVTLLSATCDASMPPRSAFEAKKAVHWWSDNIAALRRTAIAARRAYQRAGRRSGMGTREAELEAYKKVRTELKTEIRKAQERSWSELCRTIDSDPWGIPYRLVTKRLGRRSPAMDQTLRLSVARGLFPSSPRIDWESIPASGGVTALPVILPVTPPGTPLFTADEVAMVVNKLPLGKAPGPDLIPNEIIKATFKRYPKVFADCYNACLLEGTFPTPWKRAKLVLLHKGKGKPRNAPTSYRPISLLDGSGKVLERLLLERLTRHIESVGALSDLQFGFRRSRSTVDAIQQVMNVAQAAGTGAVQNRDLCVLVTIDVKNAFNTAPWRLIDAALRRCLTPEYLINILRSFMENRALVIDDSDCLPVTCGVPQGSVLGPTLWNLFYDGVLRLPVPNGIKLVAFADDVAVVAVAHNAELVEQLVNPVLKVICEWMTGNGLRLAPEKSECVVLTKKHNFRDPVLLIDSCQVAVKRAVRYLGVQLDTRLSFGEHVEAVSTSARRAASALGRLMPNVGGPAQCKRSLLMSVVHSRLLYGAAVWADEVQHAAKFRNLMLQSQRCAALRVARCYRTVSDMAALVLARMPPVTLQAVARKRATALRQEGAVLTTQQKEESIIGQWQAMWDTSTKAAWTKALIPDLRRWWSQGPREVSYHMAQALTGHGCFQSYLWRRQRAANPGCVHCPAVFDDAEHTLFVCPFWNAARADIEVALRKPVGPEDVPYLLCGPQELPEEPSMRRSAVAASKRHKELFLQMVEAILSEKEEMERQRQRQRQLNASN